MIDHMMPVLIRSPEKMTFLEQNQFANTVNTTNKGTSLNKKLELKILTNRIMKLV